MANANSPVTMPTGVPLAAPVYLVINDGSVVSSTNGVPVSVTNANANGQSTMANSSPVVIASNQGAVAIGVVSGTALTADQTNTILKTSLYVKTSAAADTVLTVGSATSANSIPVVVASDQGAVANKRSTVAVYSLASAATTSSSNSGDLTVGPYTEVSIDINTTAQTGTNPTVQFTYSRKAADGIYYALWQSAVLTAAANTLSTSIGAGMAYSQSLGVTGQLKWVIGGSNTPGYTFSVNVQGK